MDATRLGVIDDLTVITTEVRSRFGALDRAQLNWRTGEGAWSVGQCLEHLITTTDVYLVDLRAVAAGTRRVRRWERWSPFSGFFGRFLVNAMRKDSMRTRTPQRFVPPGDIAADVVKRFEQSQEELVTAVRSTATADWEATILTSPFQPIATYSLADAYLLMVEHQRRHLRQATRVTEQAAFPARPAN